MPYTEDKCPHIGLDPVTVNWSEFEKNPKLNPKELPIGTVAYYVKRRKNRYFVDYGIVYDNYSDCVVLQRLTFRDRRMIVSEFFKEPVPFKDFPHQTEWRKLPKGWSWNTQLFSYVMQEETDAEKNANIRLDEPETIIKAYNDGVLVNVRDVPYEKIEAVIEGKFGYKLIRKSKEPERVIDPDGPVDTVGIAWIQCFSTYAEAKAACDKYEAELEAQAEMSDLEWSVSLIDHDIDRWAKLRGISDENKARARDYLMGLKDLENVETRVIGEGLQYKYWKHKRWVTVPIE